MPLTATQRVMSRLTAHGANVYPLQGYGLLLGWVMDDPANGCALAALPVGKTERWYESAGRFDRIDEALAVATRRFEDWGLQPMGLYCSAYSHWDGCDTDVTDVIATAPRRLCLRWLVLRRVDGGDPSVFAPIVMRLRGGAWQEEQLVTVSVRPDQPRRNPRRIGTAWNHAWGVLDYGNRHETELQRLGLASDYPSKQV